LEVAVSKLLDEILAATEAGDADTVEEAAKAPTATSPAVSAATVGAASPPSRRSPAGPRPDPNAVPALEEPEPARRPPAWLGRSAAELLRGREGRVGSTTEVETGDAKRRRD
jgi:hypothetical protein